MPQGLEVNGPNGERIISLTDRITKILGTLVIPSSVEEDSGMLEVPDFAFGTPFYFTTGNECQKKGYIDDRGWRHGFWLLDDRVSYLPAYEIPAYEVTISFNGNIMDWHVKRYSKWWVGIKNSSFNIHYGVY